MDERDLKPANENPWYVLMTLYGEDKGQLTDEERESNRKVWNRLFGPGNGTSFDEKLKTSGLRVQRSSGQIHTLLEQIEELFGQVWKARNPSLAIPKFNEIRGKVDLTKTEFQHMLTLDGFVFKEALDLSNSKLKQGLSAQSCGFSTDVIIEFAKFKSNVSFKDSVLLGDLRGTNSEFSKSLTLEAAQIDGAFLFGMGYIQEQLNAASLEVQGQFQISSRQIKGDCDLRNGKLYGKADFVHTVLEGDCFLNQLHFEENADFIWAQFERGANFTGASFSGLSTFRHARFHNFVSFADASFQNHVDFSSAWFFTEGDNLQTFIRFNNASFANATSFRDTKFLNSYPDFSNADLHPVTDFSTDTKTERYWPEGITEPRKEARETCGIIRNLLAKKGRHEDQHFFFRKEMEFASASSDFWESLTYKIYWAFSDYGDSIARPLYWLLGVGVVTAMMLLIGFAAQDISLDNDWRFVEPFSLTFANMFKIFGFQRSVFGFDYLQCLPMWMQFIAGVQTIAGFVFLFFLGLGLRQRFRLR